MSFAGLCRGKIGAYTCAKCLGHTGPCEAGQLIVGVDVARNDADIVVYVTLQNGKLVKAVKPNND